MSDETSGLCVCVHYVQGEPAGHGFAARSGRIVGDNMCCSITSAADPGVCLYLWESHLLCELSMDDRQSAIWSPRLEPSHVH